MRLKIELERMHNGVWLAEVLGLSGVAAAGRTRLQAFRRAQAQAVRYVVHELARGNMIVDQSPRLELRFDAI